MSYGYNETPKKLYNFLAIFGTVCTVVLISIFFIWLLGKVWTTKAVARSCATCVDTVVSVPLYATWPFFPHPWLAYAGYPLLYSYMFYGGPLGIGTSVMYNNVSNTYVNNETNTTENTTTQDGSQETGDPLSNQSSVGVAADTQNTENQPSSESEGQSVSEPTQQENISNENQTNTNSSSNEEYNNDNSSSDNSSYSGSDSGESSSFSSGESFGGSSEE